MKILSKRIKVTLFVAVTVLFALTLLLMNSSKVYCAPSLGGMSVNEQTEKGEKTFFSDTVQPRWFTVGAPIFDADNSYNLLSLEPVDWKYPTGAVLQSMKTRNEETYFLYATDSTGTEVRLKPVEASNDVWTNDTAENCVTVLIKQALSLPSNVEFNNDAMTLGSSKMNEYFKVSNSGTKVDKGIVLYRKSSSPETLQNMSWNFMKLESGATLSFGNNYYVEIALLYELREKKNIITSHYSHCVAQYFLNIASR